MTTTSPDYAKFSLALGVVSVIGGLAYWRWQYVRAQTENNYHRKYDEAKNAIMDVQRAYGLMPTGKLDAPTQSLLASLKG